MTGQDERKLDTIDGYAVEHCMRLGRNVWIIFDADDAETEIALEPEEAERLIGNLREAHRRGVAQERGRVVAIVQSCIGSARASGFSTIQHAIMRVLHEIEQPDPADVAQPQGSETPRLDTKTPPRCRPVPNLGGQPCKLPPSGGGG